MTIPKEGTMFLYEHNSDYYFIAKMIYHKQYMDIWSNYKTTQLTRIYSFRNSFEVSSHALSNKLLGEVTSSDIDIIKETNPEYFI